MRQARESGKTLLGGSTEFLDKRGGLVSAGFSEDGSEAGLATLDEGADGGKRLGDAGGLGELGASMDALESGDELGRGSALYRALGVNARPDFDEAAHVGLEVVVVLNADVVHALQCPGCDALGLGVLAGGEAVLVLAISAADETEELLSQRRLGGSSAAAGRGGLDSRYLELSCLQ